MGDNSTEDTGNVTTEERDTSLGKEGVVLLGVGEVRVDQLDGSLESGELNHGVGNLSGPQGGKTLVEAGNTLSSNHLLQAIESTGSEGGHGGLGLDLNGLPGTEQDISNNLSGGGGGEVDEGLVLLSILGTDKVTVLLLEELVETVLTSTLERVTDKGGTNTGPDTTKTLRGNDGSPGLHVGGVERGVHLSSALDEIKRGDESVGNTASEHTTGDTGGVELRGVELDALGLLGLEDITGLSDLSLSIGNEGISLLLDLLDGLVERRSDVESTGTGAVRVKRGLDGGDRREKSHCVDLIQTTDGEKENPGGRDDEKIGRCPNLKFDPITTRVEFTFVRQKLILHKSVFTSPTK